MRVLVMLMSRPVSSHPISHMSLVPSARLRSPKEPGTWLANSTLSAPCCTILYGVLCPGLPAWWSTMPAIRPCQLVTALWSRLEFKARCHFAALTGIHSLASGREVGSTVDPLTLNIIEGWMEVSPS